jgi:hypothetical protein
LVSRIVWHRVEVPHGEGSPLAVAPEGSTRGQQGDASSAESIQGNSVEPCGFTKLREGLQTVENPLLIRGSQVRILPGALEKILQSSPFAFSAEETKGQRTTDGTRRQPTSQARSPRTALSSSPRRAAIARSSVEELFLVGLDVPFELYDLLLYTGRDEAFRDSADRDNEGSQCRRLAGRNGGVKTTIATSSGCSRSQRTRSGTTVSMTISSAANATQIG